MNKSRIARLLSSIAPSMAGILFLATPAAFVAPWTGKVSTTASDTDGTVSKIDFLAGSTLLGTITGPPPNASFTVTNLAAGSYTLTAVATDNGGAAMTSAGVNI